MPRDVDPFETMWQRRLAAALASRPKPVSPAVLEGLADLLLHVGAEARARAMREGDPRLRNPRILRYLLDESDAARLVEPRRALQLAQLAVELARLLPCEAVSAELRADLQAEAWARIGNAQRLVGEYREAERSFQRAEVLRSKGSLDPLIETELLRFQAHLRKAQRRFREALALAEQAVEVAERCGDRCAAGSAQIVVGTTLYRSGQPAEAVIALSAAATRINAQSEPAAGWSVLGELIHALNESGRSQIALRALAGTRSVFALTPPAVQKSAMWLEGRLRVAAGDFHQAARLLEQVRRISRKSGADYDLALATVELCLVYAKVRRPNELNLLAREISPLLGSPRIPEEAQELFSAFVERAGYWVVEASYIEEMLAELRHAATPLADTLKA